MPHRRRRAAARRQPGARTTPGRGSAIATVDACSSSAQENPPYTVPRGPSIGGLSRGGAPQRAAISPFRSYHSQSFAVSPTLETASRAVVKSAAVSGTFSVSVPDSSASFEPFWRSLREAVLYGEAHVGRA